MKTCNPMGWLVIGVGLLLGELLFMGTTLWWYGIRHVPWWAIALMCLVALVTVWCLGVADDLWQLEVEEEKPYTGPERRQQPRNEPAPHLNLVEVKPGSALDRQLRHPVTPGHVHRGPVVPGATKGVDELV